MPVRHIVFAMMLLATLPASAETGGPSPLQLAQDIQPGWFMVFQRQDGSVFGEGKGPYSSEEACRNDPFFNVRAAEAREHKISLICKYYANPPW